MTNAQLMKSIADQLAKDCNVPEESAIEAARNVIGFYETILK